MTKKKKINKIKPTAKIDTKEKFKNKYIDLSNKELNGEVTEEVFNKLKECLAEIGFSTYHMSHYYFGHCDYQGSRNCRFVVECKDEKGCVDNINQIDFDHYKEVSIYDIKGMDKPTAKPKITVTNTKPTTIQANNETEEIRVNTPFFKKYTINDLKNNKIAVHLPTQEEWDRAMKFFEENSIPCCDGTCATSLDPLSQTPSEQVCVDITNEFNGFVHIEQDCCKYYKRVGCTIITLDQLEGLEPTAEEDKYWIEYQEGVAKIRLELLNKIIIKYQGKEKVITRDDFEDEKKVFRDSKGNVVLTQERITINVPENDLGYAEGEDWEGMAESLLTKGTRAWVLLALDRGEKVRHNTWDENEYIYLFDSASSGQLLGEDDNFPEEIYLYKDGWELYKEKKTMTYDYELISKKCVNSNHWLASFLDDKGEKCQCGMCKLKFKNKEGYEFIMDKEDIDDLKAYGKTFNMK
jgi:hypothetical protein